MKYRKKSIVVEAEQFFHNKPLPFRDHGAVVECKFGVFFVTTIHQQAAILADGDWVILESRLKHFAYPCKPDIFTATYEPVEDDDGQ